LSRAICGDVAGNTQRLNAVLPYSETPENLKDLLYVAAQAEAAT
jgi:hypothetical protein